MSLELQGIFYLIAVGLFVIAALVSLSAKGAVARLWPAFAAAGLAVAFFVPMFNAFDAA